MKIKNFSRSKKVLSLPSLLIYQKESWNQFWKEGLKEVFEEILPIQDYTGKQFEIDFINYRLAEPKYKRGDEAKENNDTFEAPLKVKAK